MTGALYTGGIFACVLGVIAGIRLMNSPATAFWGNLMGAFSLGFGVFLTLLHENLLGYPLIWAAIVAGILLGVFLAVVVKTIQMPQTVALLNGVGGAASALVGLAMLVAPEPLPTGEQCASVLALITGAVTFSGSLTAAGKLSGILAQKPAVISNYRAYSTLLAMLLTLLTLWLSVSAGMFTSLFALAVALLLGVLFAIRIGGADMPIAISLLNSMSGISAAIAGFAVNNVFLVAVGAIVGAAGFILTRIMCTAMNRSLSQILAGATTTTGAATPETVHGQDTEPQDQEEHADLDVASILKTAQTIIIVPGYGMALSQAQEQVKQISDVLQALGKTVKFAIHPVAGRMPGHMHVLLAEVDIPYDMLFEMDAINEEFEQTDLALVVGANDVVNPAASTAENTPIYGMPILLAGKARHVIVCNLDDKPGYAGVPNSLYKQHNTVLLQGNASETLQGLLASLSQG